jgi:isocitrate dehydrogenase kinase/phosphatase
MQLSTDSRLCNIAAEAIYSGFESYQTQFKNLTRRAQSRFETRDWHGMYSDAAERLALYRKTTDPALREIQNALTNRSRDRSLWAGMKAVFSGLITDLADRELAETYFNSVTRRIFTTVGVDPQVEFVDSDFDVSAARDGIITAYEGPQPSAAFIENILSSTPFARLFEDLRRDAWLTAAEIPEMIDRMEMLTPVFYRGSGAYLIGRIFSRGSALPLALCLLHTADGVFLDAVLLREDEVSILFSFTRSYFHVDVDFACELIQFLKSIMPRKPVSELYTSIGRHKHGKTELYRDLLRHLASTDDRFEIAPGARGMVMSVFTLPSFEVVFKVIKDSFDYPKQTSRRDVMAKYGLVFTHDRAGRLVDAQEFEHLRFDRTRFAPALLQELLRVAQNSVSADEESVVIDHLYTERRVIPLDVFLREAPAETAQAAVIDYGYAMKDLARANVFPGDVLAKNFGVTRHGRVIFYDYDELCLLTDCNFRPLPQADDEMDMFTEEPWFCVAENDYFPEEFLRFLGLPPECRATFVDHHADLLQPEFWRRIQERIRGGEIIHIFPYPQSKRLRKY